jgi:hypothetical protein
MGKPPLLALGLACVAACGKVEGFADATPAAPDAIPYGAATVDVRTLNNDGLPEIGATVVFVDSDGTITRVAAGQDGKATANVHPGSLVTAIWLQASGPYLVTILDIEPGDELRVGRPATLGNAVTGTAALTVPETTPPSPKQAYTVCGSTPFEGTGPVTLQWFEYCDQADTDVIVASRDASGNESQYAYIGNVPNGQRATIAVPGPWKFFETFNVGFTDLPAETRAIEVRRTLRSGALVLWQTGTGGEVTTQTPSFAIPGSPVAGDTMEVDVTVRRSNTETVYYGGSNFRLRLPVNTTLQARIADHALPFVGQPQLDLANRTIAWPQTAGGIAADAIIVDTYFTRTPPDAGSSIQTQWRVIAPGGATSLTLPTLPTELEELLPRPTDETNFGTLVLLASSDHDYRQVRATADLGYIDWVYGAGPAEARVISVSGLNQR